MLSASKQHWLAATYWPDCLQIACKVCMDGYAGPLFEPFEVCEFGIEPSGSMKYWETIEWPNI
jgi:hypothetical protein